MVLPIVTGRNEVVAKVMFLLVCVILFTGGVSPEEDPLGRRHPPWQGDPPEGGTPLARRPPREGGTPWQGDPPQKEAPPLARRPPWQRDPREGGPPPWHTVNEWLVHILLECILVS